jgi:flagellin
MPVSIISNTAAAIAQKNIAETDNDISRSLTKLSSGDRIFSAQEDAASLAVGAGLSTQVSAYRAAQINVSSGTSMLQIADGSLGKISDIIIRMRQLSSQAISGHVSDVERSFIDEEYQELLAEIDRISASTEFNGVNMLGGSTQTQLNTIGANVDTDDGFVGFQFGPSVNPGDVFEVAFISATNVMTLTNVTQGISQTLYVSTPQAGHTTEYTFASLGVELTINSDFDDTADIVPLGANEQFDTVAAGVAAPVTVEFQIGTGTNASDRITVDLPFTNTNSLGLAGTSLDNVANVTTALQALNTAIDNLNVNRGELGAAMSRLEFAGANIAVILENTLVTRSSLLDVDVADEITKLTSKQVLIQTALNMLGRANERPDVILNLLR